MTVSKLEKDGMAQAAILSAGIGVLALALANLGTEISENFKEKTQALGKLWIPGAEGIGPYSGKETILLVTWLGSWLLLHFLLREKELDDAFAIGVFLSLIAVATTLLWPSATHWVVSWVK